MKPEKIKLGIEQICEVTGKDGKIEVEHGANSIACCSDSDTTIIHAGEGPKPAAPGEHKRLPQSLVGKEVSAMTDKPKTPAKRVVEIDTAKYQTYLDDPSLDEATKQEIVEAIWSIILNFVDLGFEVHPLQEAHGPEPCGKLTRGVDGSAVKDSNESKPVQALTAEFERASDDT